MKTNKMPKYFSSTEKGGNVVAKASKLIIDVPQFEDDEPTVNLNKNSPSHSRGTLKHPKKLLDSRPSRTPKSPKLQNYSRSEENTPKSKANLPKPQEPLVSKTVSRSPYIFKAKANILSNKSTPKLKKSRNLTSSPNRKSQKDDKKTKSKPPTPKNPRTPLTSVVTKVAYREHPTEDKSEAIYREHLFSTFQAMKIVKDLPEVDRIQLREKRLNVPRRKGYESKKTLVFDLDETLVHCCDDIETENPDVILPITFPTGEVVEAGINIRPNVYQCLREVSKDFEVFVFTASHQCYADVVLDYLDPQKKYIHQRFYRENCVNVDGVYIKDLRIFGNRKLSEIVIVDNAAYSFAYQLDNGIPIISWHNDYFDKELLNLLDYLKAIEVAEDVRDVNRDTFHLRTFYEDYIQEFLAVG